MSNRSNKRAIEMGDVVVMTGGIGGPAMRVLGFGRCNEGICLGATAKLESLRRDGRDSETAAWTAEFLLENLRVLPPGHSGARPPFRDFSMAGRDSGR